MANFCVCSAIQHVLRRRYQNAFCAVCYFFFGLVVRMFQWFDWLAWLRFVLLDTTLALTVQQ